MSTNPDAPDNTSSTSQDSSSGEVTEKEPSTKGESPQAQNLVMVSLRKIIFGVIIAAVISGFSVGRVVDDIWPNKPLRPVAERFKPVRERLGRTIAYELKSVVSDLTDGWISPDEATDEIVEIFKEVAPTNKEVKAQIKGILEKAQQEGTPQAGPVAYRELIALLSSLMQPSPTPAPTPTILQRQ